MPRQDSTAEQLADLARWAVEEAHADAAYWIQSEGQRGLSLSGFMCLERLAIKHECYDAHDLIRRWWEGGSSPSTNE